MLTMLTSANTLKVNFKEHGNVEIIDSSDNWSSLQFFEAYYIKNLKPIINEGLKASKDFELFSSPLVLYLFVYYFKCLKSSRDL